MMLASSRHPRWPARSLDWLFQLGTQPRRRRASAALGPLRVWPSGRAAMAVIAGVALLFAGLAVFRVWSAIHAISPRAQPADLITLVHAQADEPGSLGGKI